VRKERESEWRSREQARRHRPKAHPIGLQVRCEWIHCSPRLRLRVTFEPGARTAWHTHPLGQTLLVTAGVGWTQREGGPVEEIRPGDVVWFAPGEKRWHGVTATTGMTHIAIQESLDGKVVEWMEQVSEEQYKGSIYKR